MAKKAKVLLTQPSLIGKKIYLRPRTHDDAINAYFWFLQSEPQSQSCHPLSFMTPTEASEKAKKVEKSPNQQRFAIVRIDNNVHVGEISFYNLNNLNRSAELGILIDPDEQKEGFGKEAMRILIKYLFHYRGLNKVYGETAEFNNPAVKLLESLHFHQDGVLRKHHFYNNEYYDKLVYSLLHHEFSD